MQIAELQRSRALTTRFNLAYQTLAKDLASIAVTALFNLARPRDAGEEPSLWSLGEGPLCVSEIQAPDRVNGGPTAITEDGSRRLAVFQAVADIFGLNDLTVPTLTLASPAGETADARTVCFLALLFIPSTGRVFRFALSRPNKKYLPTNVYAGPSLQCALRA